jgi:hypothetical protein
MVLLQSFFFLQHGNPMGASTNSACTQRVYAFSHFCLFAYGGKVPSFEVVMRAWPPTETMWPEYLADARATAGSHDSCKLEVSHVCTVGITYWGQQQVPREASDPRILYREQHKRMCGMLGREFGLSRSQVQPITMEEARSGPYFCDRDSVMGLLEGCAWTLGALLGGRRPRTLTAMRAADVVFKIDETQVAGQPVPVRVVVAKVTFREEKVDDVQGPRFLQDDLGKAIKADKLMWSFGQWVYEGFRLRGLFQVTDPLHVGRIGQTIRVRDECGMFYVFCKACDVCWVLGRHYSCGCANPITVEQGHFEEDGSTRARV